MTDYEDTVLQGLVTVTGVIVGFLKAKEGALVVGAVPDDALLVGCAQLEQLRGIEDTGITVDRFFAFQEERPVGAEGIQHPSGKLAAGKRPGPEPCIEDGKAVVVVCQAVRNNVDRLDFRGNPAQRLHQTGIAVYIPVEPAYNLVIGEPVRLEGVVFLRYGFEGIGQVESVVLLLGVQHKRELVALLHGGNHLTTLSAVLLGEVLV